MITFLCFIFILFMYFVVGFLFVYMHHLCLSQVKCKNELNFVLFTFITRFSLKLKCSKINFCFIIGKLLLWYCQVVLFIILIIYFCFFEGPWFIYWMRLYYYIWLKNPQLFIIINTKNWTLLPNPMNLRIINNIFVL